LSLPPSLACAFVPAGSCRRFRRWPSNPTSPALGCFQLRQEAKRWVGDSFFVSFSFLFCFCFPPFSSLARQGRQAGRGRWPQPPLRAGNLHTAAGSQERCFFKADRGEKQVLQPSTGVRTRTSGGCVLHRAPAWRRTKDRTQTWGAKGAFGPTAPVQPCHSLTTSSGAPFVDLGEGRSLVRRRPPRCPR